jgi:hypothetical protein
MDRQKKSSSMALARILRLLIMIIYLSLGFALCLWVQLPITWLYIVLVIQHN